MDTISVVVEGSSSVAPRMQNDPPCSLPACTATLTATPCPGCSCSPGAAFVQQRETVSGSAQALTAGPHEGCWVLVAASRGLHVGTALHAAVPHSAAECICPGANCLNLSEDLTSSNNTKASCLMLGLAGNLERVRNLLSQAEPKNKVLHLWKKMDSKGKDKIQKFM